MLNQVQTNQLVAGIRDAMLAEFRKAIPKADQSAQAFAAETFTSSAQELVGDVVERLVDIHYAEGFPALAGKLKKIQHGDKPEVVVVLDTAADIPWDKLHGTVKSDVSLVLCWTTRFDQQRPAPVIEPDQPPLFRGEADDEDDDTRPVLMMNDDQEEGPAAETSIITGGTFSYYISCPVTGPHAGQYGLTTPADHVLCWHYHDKPIASMMEALNAHERDHGPIIGYAKAVEIARAAIPEGYSVVFEPDPSAVDANSAPASEPESAARTRRGRPSKADMQAASEAGKQAFRNGVPIKDGPDLCNTLTQCWAAGWRAAETEQADARVPADLAPAMTGLPAPAEAAE